MTKNIKLVVSCLVAVCILGCASDKQAGTAPKQASVPKPANYPKPPDHAKVATVHFPMAAAHTSAENSLAVSGFKIDKADDVFIEANRPHHMGLFVGSGGETCRIWLNSVATNETEIKVDSSKSFVGMMGQKEWDSTVLAEILRDLNK